jgi:hypothetical protein
MIEALKQKIVAITPPGAIVDNAALTTTAVDTLGFAWADIYIHLGATDVAMAALKLQESDASGSGFADITGADFSSGTLSDGTAAALPSATADNKFYAIRVDLRGRKRYLDLVATGGDGTAGAYIVAFAVLSRASEDPNSMSERGITGEIIV